MNTENEFFEKYIQKLDTRDPSLYVVKLKNPMSKEQYKNIHKNFNIVFSKFNPNSKLLNLDSAFESIHIFNEAEMNKLGWVRKGKDE